uniref:tRNA threonylcarbamoyladenosine biosynthesis protein TsaB n=1 Tax=Candidatus Kentrum eta TaxID=2126337 RepID=A0A450UWK9_9GAMM|nr:MAG: tRNA threonylcarbamoyl adenosine modification protein YeaZ [Candidatus Kentron sp. H]VFJ97120.1 MAG: tRNA threonylcarbamoyl adenosine modification protein YeaZ [Candidatus Kentron sp. H]VFK02851.1 MAG: tRNA threonylcarbamoyl adenosine modification protein YeaZ [Candidatus Kentron sp. H]
MNPDVPFESRIPESPLPPRQNRPMKILAIDTATDACSVALHLDGEYWGRHELAPRQHAEILLPRIRELLSEAGLSLNHLDALAFGRGPGAFTGVRIATSVAQGLAFGADLPVVPISSLHALAQGAWRERGERNLLAALDARMGEVYWGAYRVAAAEALLSDPQRPGDIHEEENRRTLPCAAPAPHQSSRSTTGNHPVTITETTIEEICRCPAPVVEECVSGPDRVPLPESRLWEREPIAWFGVGSGWRTYEAALRRALAGRSPSGHHQLAGIEPDRYPQARDIATLAIAALGRGESVTPEQAQPVYLRDRVTRTP